MGLVCSLGFGVTHRNVAQIRGKVAQWGVRHQLVKILEVSVDVGAVAVHIPRKAANAQGFTAFGRYYTVGLLDETPLGKILSHEGPSLI